MDYEQYKAKIFEPQDAFTCSGNRAYMLRMMQIGCTCGTEELKQNEPRPMVLYSNGSVVAHMPDIYKMKWQIAPEYRTFYIDPALCIMNYNLVMLSMN